jgi:hypothetical protein
MGLYSVGRRGKSGHRQFSLHFDFARLWIKSGGVARRQQKKFTLIRQGNELIRARQLPLAAAAAQHEQVGMFENPASAVGDKQMWMEIGHISLCKYAATDYIRASSGEPCNMMSMVFAFLCFTGIFIMFFYLMRSLEKFQERTRDEHAQLRVQMRALEVRLDTLTSAVPAQTPLPAAPLLPDDPQAPLVLAPRDPLDAALEDPLIQFEPKR